MKIILSLIISGALVVSGFGQTRNVLVGTNNAVVQPTNFWSADASNARSGLGLGSAATNPASTFQSSSSVLSNLASSNAVNLTNLRATNIVGVIPSSNISTVTIPSGGTGATNAETARTNFGLGWSALTNTNAATSLLGAMTNGVVVSGITNPLVFTSEVRFGQGDLQIDQNGAILWGGDLRYEPETQTFYDQVQFDSPLTASNTRNNLGIPWVGLTNANASGFRSALGLGTAATNQASAFQPSSSVLTNLSVNNGGSLTNLQANSIVGVIPASNISTVNLTNVTGVVAISSGGTGATNASTARLNLGSGIAGDALFTSANASSARTVLGATPIGSSVFTLASPSAVRFLRINADNTASALSDSDFRLSIGLGTAATNSSSAFQPSSSILTNLSANNGASLTNIQATNVSGVLPLASGGTGSSVAGGARTNLGLGSTWLTNNNVTNFRLAIGLGASDNVSFNTVDIDGNLSVTASGLFSTGFSGELNFEEKKFSAGFFGAAPHDWDFVSSGITNSGAIWFSSSETAAKTRTNLGLGASWLTNVTTTNFRSSVGLGSTWLTNTNVTNFRSEVGLGSTWLTNTNVTNFRSEIGLGWSALTNTNSTNFQSALFGSGTNPVLVNTSGLVVSPSNFWQVIAISNFLQNFEPLSNATNNATNARILSVYSMAPSISGITNVITLPTNTSTLSGDIATVIHLPTSTSSVTIVRQLGSTNNLASLRNPEEGANFIYRNGSWRIGNNYSFVSPIYFSGANAATNAAISRTNLGLGNNSAPIFGGLTLTGGDVLLSTAIEDNGVAISRGYSTNGDTFLLNLGFTNNTVCMFAPISFGTTSAANATRTNLGIGTPEAASVAFRGGNNQSNAAVMFISDSSAGLYDGPADTWALSVEDEGFIFNGSNRRNAFQGALFTSTNSAPTNTTNVNAWVDIHIGTNMFKVPLYK